MPRVKPERPARKVLKEDVVWEAFKIFDADGSGTVTNLDVLGFRV